MITFKNRCLELKVRCRNTEVVIRIPALVIFALLYPAATLLALLEFFAGKP